MGGTRAPKVLQKKNDKEGGTTKKSNSGSKRIQCRGPLDETNLDGKPGWDSPGSAYGHD